ncbi:uncharacterized protein LOC142977371 [Anticarsia gemmatalis]|uniref:uncharacterized protein LOC142977371 n=1 Tax=Anticarsia gemmatalis TaxID=129554 RepID=UPI003F760900
MCFNVNLPTVSSFLMLYSLRCGSIIIMLWTMIGWYLLFLIFVILELYAFIVVYSHYKELLYEGKMRRKMRG